jgi:hypothetical protein
MRKIDKLDSIPYYHDIREALRSTASLAVDQPGCAFCHLLTQSADRYLDSVLWELVNDGTVRRELNRARGYCQQHGWLLVRAGAAAGVAILMRDVVKTLLDVLESTPDKRAAESGLQGLFRSRDKGQPTKTTKLVDELSPQSPCPACAHIQDREKDLIKTLMTHLDGPGALEGTYRASDGLCLAHFRQALANAPSGKAARILVAAQQSIWQRLHAELDEFVRKQDIRFRGEPFGEERDSWLRALESISGPEPQGRSERQGLTQSM